MSLHHGHIQCLIYSEYSTSILRLCHSNSSLTPHNPSKWLCRLRARSNGGRLSSELFVAGPSEDPIKLSPVPRCVVLLMQITHAIRQLRSMAERHRWLHLVAALVNSINASAT
jgi:hypothetical protein